MYRQKRSKRKQSYPVMILSSVVAKIFKATIKLIKSIVANMTTLPLPTKIASSERHLNLPSRLTLVINTVTDFYRLGRKRSLNSIQTAYSRIYAGTRIYQYIANTSLEYLINSVDGREGSIPRTVFIIWTQTFQLIDIYLSCA